MKNILALDVATKTGWAVSNDIYGLWDLSIKRDESSGMRLVRFEGKLREIIELQDIRLVAYERVAGRFQGAVIIAAEIVGVMKSVLEDKNIPYRAFSAKEIKVFATGKGNSGKPLMISAARSKYNYTGEDDNEADALHLLNLMKKEYLGVDLKKQQLQHKKVQIIRKQHLKRK